ncbi:hypothetical protein ACH5RR_008669 [Cinchona calisaya]|uniref:LysM domain-containing protein n=1 Tax=Cinchona calisaya TaxID=153742 RepID=A0ABD3ACA2_9GENT
MKLHDQYFVTLSLLGILPLTYSKSVIEPCTSSDSCTSFLSYRLPFGSKLPEIAYRFQINISDILASNSLDHDLTQPSFWNQILFPRNSILKLPISCPCTNGIRQSLLTHYAVQPADSVASIADSYGGLVSADQIMAVNGVNASNPLATGESLVIPLPCACFNNSNYGAATVYMSYVVQAGESLSSLAKVYGTTVSNLESVNGLGEPHVHPGDILAIPLPACSSANLNWHNESLIVPNGSQVLTANNCIKCKCGPTILNLQCSASGLLASCSRLQCKGSNLFIGDVQQTHTVHGCNVSTCVYRGHFGRKIFSSLVNSTQVQCTGKYRSHPANPYLTLCPASAPSQSPYSAYNGPMGSIGTNNNPASREVAFKSGTNRKLLGEISCSCLVLLEITIIFVLFFYT